MNKVPRIFITVMTASTLAFSIFRPVPPFYKEGPPEAKVIISKMQLKISTDRSPGYRSRRKRHEEIVQKYSKYKKSITDKRKAAHARNWGLYNYQLSTNPSNYATEKRLKSVYIEEIKSINAEYDFYLVALEDKMGFEFQEIMKSE